MKNDSLPELGHLADLIGEFIEYWGFKKIHGKIWLNLYLSTTPLDAAALMAKLNVSKSLISISIKDLLDYNVIFEIGPSSVGTKLYQANPELKTVITLVLRKREKIMMGKIQAAFSQLNQVAKKEISANRVNSERLNVLGKFIKNGEKGLDAFIALL